MPKQVNLHVSGEYGVVPAHLKAVVEPYSLFRGCASSGMMRMSQVVDSPHSLASTAMGTAPNQARPVLSCLSLKPLGLPDTSRRDMAATMKALNSGCPAHGVDLNSG